MFLLNIDDINAQGLTGEKNPTNKQKETAEHFSNYSPKLSIGCSSALRTLMTQHNMIQHKNVKEISEWSWGKTEHTQLYRVKESFFHFWIKKGKKLWSGAIALISLPSLLLYRFICTALSGSVHRYGSKDQVRGIGNDKYCSVFFIIRTSTAFSALSAWDKYINGN